MKIYSYNFHPYVESSTKYNSNGSIYPVKFDGVIFDKNNPYYVKTTASKYSPFLTYPLQVSRASTSTPYTVGQVEPGIGNTCHGFPRLIYVPDKVTVSYATLLNTTTISGKYRTKFPAYSTPSTYLSDGCVDVKVSINDETYCALCFPCDNTLWYCKRIPWTNNSPKPTPKYLTAYKEPSNILENPIGYTVLTSEVNTLKSEYMGVWDFGDTPQIVPEVFKTWLEQFAEPIYPYTFTVKSQNGVNILSSITEAPPMVDATPSAVGNVKTLTMTGVNGKTYIMKWESETPERKQFLGLAYGANETRASIPIGRTTPVTWDGSLTIYEAYGTYRPPVTTFDINLYQNSAEVNRVDKTDYLTGVGTLSGVLREECSIVAPSITFKQTTVPSFNYVYIAAFGRYYYVTDITSVSKDIWRMSLSCDVLMTWKDGIRALTAIIARQENDYNDDLIDTEVPTEKEPTVTYQLIANNVLNTQETEDTHSFVLTVVGA